MNKERFREGVSVRDIEHFARQHSTEVFSILTIIIAAISSIFDFFTGPSWTIFFTAIGAVAAVLFPTHAEKGLKQFYNFTFKQEKSTQLIIGVVKLVVAIFVPFILFGLLGLLAGSSFHYFLRHAQVVSMNLPPKGTQRKEPEEHD